MMNQNLYKLCSNYDNLEDIKIEGTVRKIDKLYHKEVIVEYSKGNSTSFFAPQDLKFSFKEKTIGLKHLKPFTKVNTFINDNQFEKRKKSYQNILGKKFLRSRLKKLLVLWKLSDKKGVLNKLDEKKIIFDEELLEDWRFYNRDYDTSVKNVIDFQSVISLYSEKHIELSKKKGLFLGFDRNNFFIFQGNKVLRLPKKKLLSPKYKKYKSTRIKSGDFIAQYVKFDEQKDNW